MLKGTGTLASKSRVTVGEGYERFGVDLDHLSNNVDGKNLRKEDKIKT